jgi:hypothetical protein
MSLKMQISKYLYMTTGQLRATVPDMAAQSDRSVQRTLKKDLNAKPRGRSQTVGKDEKETSIRRKYKD